MSRSILAFNLSSTSCLELEFETRDAVMAVAGSRKYARRALLVLPPPHANDMPRHRHKRIREMYTSGSRDFVFAAL